MDGYGAIGVDGCRLTTEGHDLTEDTHSSVHEVLEVVGIYTGGCFGGHGCWVRVEVGGRQTSLTRTGY